MKKLLSELSLLNLGMALTYLLVNITSIVVVTSIMGLNIPLAFITSGINTIIFNYVCKNKVPAFIGISGAFIGGTLAIKASEGVAYAIGGVFMVGIVYLLFALILVKHQKKLFKFIPPYILATAVILLALSLIPIGGGLLKTHLLTGLVAIASMVIIELVVKNSFIKLFSMPISIAISTAFHAVVYGLNLSVLSKPLALAFIAPQFSLGAFFMVTLTAFAVMYETIGDTSYISETCGVDVINDIGFHRMFLALGLGALINGSTGASVPTTYSENISAVRLTQHKNPFTHVFTGLMFIALGFSPLVKYALVIPQASFGGVLLMLFATVMTSGINGLIKSGIKFDINHKEMIIVSLMFAIFFIQFMVNGITVSSMAIAVIVGIALNAILNRK